MGTASELPALPVRGYRWSGGLVVDNFAGGGGASTGISQAIHKSPDIAVNHNAEALMMHEENHPDTVHYNESVWDVHIPTATAGIPVLFGWFSPDCTHFSVAKGGAPVKKEIRGLAWIIKKWAGQGDMAVFFMENVPEFVSWGPLIAKRCKETGRVVTLDMIPDPKGGKKLVNRVAEPGELVPYRNQALVPDKKRAGKTFKQFLKQLRAMGYNIEFDTLVASEYGAATIRKRFFGIGRKDGLPIIWPAKTHAPKDIALANGLKPQETAGAHLDWSIPCPSIWQEGRKPLAENTLRRIAKGIEKFVINAGDDAFLVKVNHGYDHFRGQSLDEPLQTITGKLGTGVVNVTLAAGMKFRGDSAGFDCNEPLPTITAGGGAARPAGAPHALGAMQVDLEPVSAEFITTVDHASTRNPASGLDEPLSTVTGKARHLRVAALLKHYTGVTGQMLDKPIGTITSKDHHSVLEAQLQELDPAHDLDEAITAAHIQRDFGKSVGSAASQPLGAITAGGSGKAALVATSLRLYNSDLENGDRYDADGSIEGTGGDGRASSARGWDDLEGLEKDQRGETQALQAGSSGHSFEQRIQDGALLVHGEKAHRQCASGRVCSAEGAHTRGDGHQPQGRKQAPQPAFESGTNDQRPEPRPCVCHRAEETPTDPDSGRASGLCQQASGARSDLQGNSRDLGVQPNHSVPGRADKVRAFILKYYTTGAIGQSLHDPLHTITSKARLGLVTIHGTDYQIVDIGMRMLKPHELYRCQGFPEGYEHETVLGKKLPDHAQVRMVGNSVPPQLARALVEANIPKWALEREEALRA